MKNIRIFIMALMFFTRIPVPRFMQVYSGPEMKHIMRHFPLIGILIGSIGALSFKLLTLLELPSDIIIIITMIIMTALTGAIHEDGLADSADAFGGGGNNKEKILTIMKDSRLGTYGVLTLIFSTLLKFSLLRVFPANLIPAALILSNTFSRYFTCFFLLTDKYAGNVEQSKSRSVVAPIASVDLLIATAWVLAISFLFFPLKAFLSAIPLALTWIGLKFYFNHKIDGYTGDTLGFAEQIFELIFLITFYKVILS